MNKGNKKQKKDEKQELNKDELSKVSGGVTANTKLLPAKYIMY